MPAARSAGASTQSSPRPAPAWVRRSARSCTGRSGRSGAVSNRFTITESKAAKMLRWTEENKMKVRIIVDSTADMAPRYRGRAAVAPLTIHFGGEELIDGVSIDRRRFYERLVESDALPTTSQASPPCFSSSMRTRSGRGRARWSSPSPRSSPEPTRAPALRRRTMKTSMSLTV